MILAPCSHLIGDLNVPHLCIRSRPVTGITTGFYMVATDPNRPCPAGKGAARVLPERERAAGSCPWRHVRDCNLQTHLVDPWQCDLGEQAPVAQSMQVLNTCVPECPCWWSNSPCVGDPAPHVAHDHRLRPGLIALQAYGATIVLLVPSCADGHPKRLTW